MTSTYDPTADGPTERSFGGFGGDSPGPGTPSPELLLEQRSWLRALARKLVTDPGTVEDVVQETWLTAITRPPKVTGSIRPWLAQVLRNHVLQRRRKDSSAQRRERAAAQSEALPSHDEMYERMDAQRVLVEEVLALPEPFRSAVSLRFFEERSAADIAQQFGVPPATVRSRIKRGLDQLRGRLDSRYDGERGAWMAALMPFALSSPGAPWLPNEPATATATEAGPTGSGLLPSPLPEVLQGALTMNFATKLAALTGVVLVAAFGFSRLQESDDAGRSDGTLAAVRSDAARESQAEPSIQDLEPAAALPETPAERVAIDSVRAEPPPDPAPLPEPAAATPPATIQARFLDANGQPVSGATIERLQGTPSRSAKRSGADGKLELEFDVIRVGQMLTLLYAAPGYTRGRVEAFGTPGVTTVVGDIVLLPGSSVHGFVVDAFERPVAGASVWCYGPDLPKRDELLLRRQGAFADWGQEDHSRDLERLTEEDGSFVLEGAPVGELRLFAVAKGMRYTWSDVLEPRAGEGLYDVVLRLDALHENDHITGRVVGPDGEPMPNALVEFSFTAPTVAMSSGTKVDEAGEFEIIVWDDVPYDLTAVDPQRELGSASQVGVEPGTHGLVLRLGAEAGMLLVVTNPEGEPVSGFEAEATVHQGNITLTGRGVLTQLDPPQPGRGWFKGPGQEFYLAVEAPGYQALQLGPFDPLNLPGQLEIELAPTTAVRGFVVTADGQPVPGATVQLVALAGNFSQIYMECNGARSRFECYARDDIETDAEGAFALSLREDGQYVVRAHAEGNAWAESELMQLYTESGLEDLVLQLDEGGRLVVTVVRPDGGKTAGTIVQVSRGDGLARTARADGEGRVEFTLLTPGDWNVVATEAELNPNSNSSMSRDYQAGENRELPSVCKVRPDHTTRYELVLE